MRAGRILVVVTVGALGLGLFVGTAVAGKKKSTTVIFNSGSPSVSGKNVKARGSLKTASACLVTRGIKLFQTDASGNVLATLDSKSTDSNGNWNVSGQIPISVPANTPFYVQVKVTKRTVGKFVCKAGLSPVTPLTSPKMGEDHANSTVTIKNTAPSTFKGKVTSSDDACVKNRAVKLFQGEKSISQGITDKNGVWRVALEGKLTGEFHAKVKSHRVGSLVCRADKSPTIDV